MSIPFSGIGGETAPGTIQPPDDYQKVQASPDAFGAGIAQAFGQAGNSLERVGGEAVQTAIQQKIFQDHMAITGALNQFQDTAQQIQFGDPNNAQDRGYYGLKGKQALDAHPDAVGGLQDALQSTREQLADPRQQQMFDQQSRRLYFSTQQTMARHYQQQQTQYGVDISKAAVASNLTGAVSFFNDDDAFKNHLADAVTAQQQADKIAGLPPETAALNTQATISSGWEARIRRVAADDPMAANKMLHDNLGALLPDVQTRLIDGLKSQVKSKEADIVGNNSVVIPSNAPLAPAIAQEAQSQGVSPRLALGTAKIESDVGRAADRPGSQVQGVFQMSDGTWAARGGSADNRHDVSAQVHYGVANLAHSQQVAATALGTAPADWQTYLVHQQGDGGGTALLAADPNADAASALATAYHGDVAKARQAITANGGQAGMSVGNFLGVWQKKFDTAAGPAPAGSYQEASARTSMNDASGPPQVPPPPQTPADYYRSNYDDILQSARDQATKMHPEDPTFADLAASRAQQKMNIAISGQQKSYETDSNTLFRAANGDLNKGTAPGSISDLVASSPEAAAAWQRVQVQQPQLAHTIATRVLSQAASPDKDKDAATYGSAFYSTFSAIHAPDGSPNKITDPDQLYGLLGKGLTMAGVAKAREEIMSRRTPEGEAEASMRTEFLKTAKGQISGTDDGLGIKDPKGEEIYLRFMGQALPAIQAAKAKGLTAAQIYSPDSPDYVGKIIPGFKRTLAQRTADMMEGSDAPPKAPDPPSLFARIFGHAPAPDLTTAEGIRSAVQSGKMTRTDAVARLRSISAPATPALTPAATETLPSGPQVPTSD